MRLLLTFLLFLLPLAPAVRVWGDAHPHGHQPGSRSKVTALPYNRKGGFSLLRVKSGARSRMHGPNLILISGGSFVSGPSQRAQSRAVLEKNPRVEVADFLLDETPVTNIAWQEMLHWLDEYGLVAQVKATTPSNAVFQSLPAESAKLASGYFEKPAYRYHPVVGITQTQARFFCLWRTFVVNLNILRRSRIKLESLRDHTVAEIAGVKVSEWQEIPELKEFLSYRISDLLRSKRRQARIKEREKRARDAEDDEEDDVEDNEGDDEDEEEEEEDKDGLRRKPSPVKQMREQGKLLPAPYRLPTAQEWEYAAKCESPVLLEQHNRRVRSRKVDLVRNQQENDNQPTVAWDIRALRLPDGTMLANIRTSSLEIAYRPARMRQKSVSIPFLSYVYHYPPNAFGLYDMLGNVAEMAVQLPSKNATSSTYVLPGIALQPQSSQTSESPSSTLPTVCYKGASWQDGAMRLDPGFSYQLHSDAAAAFIGFRCAMSLPSKK